MKVDFDFFKIDSALAPQKGRIIISEPFLPGNFFSRSTVLLVDYSPKGAVGFILNKPIDNQINELLSIHPDFTPEVFVGGPVGNDSLFYIHTLGDMISGSIKVKDELYWGGDFEELKSAIASGKAKHDQIKFFVGYSGWSAGQLDDEITENSWLVTEADIKQIMKSNQNFWLESVMKAGGHYKTWRNFPEDPNSN
jgi:putative transcriptional regulator